MPDDTHSDDERERDRLTRRQLRICMAVAFVVGFAVVPAMAGFLTNSAPTSGEVPLRSTNGPKVILAGNTEANLTAPFPNSETVRLRTADGNVTFSSSGKTTARIEAAEINGTWTNTTGLSVGSTALTVNPGDKQRIVVTGGTTEFNFTSMKVGDGKTDFAYAGPSGSTTVTIHGLPTGKVLTAVDATGTTLDSASTGSNGVATFELPNSDHTVELQEATDPSEIAPYYTNQSADVDNETWMSDRKDATLDNVTSYITRIGTFIIGSGSSQGDVGDAGTWLIMIMGFAIFLAAIVATEVGPVGGATLGLAAAGGFAAANVSPVWIYALILFAAGIVLTTVLIRAVR